jgi:Zn-dependent protease with chaperone function
MGRGSHLPRGGIIIVRIMFILNLAVNWTAVGALVTVIYILSTNSIDWPSIILITSAIVGAIILIFLSPWGEIMARKPYRPLTKREHEYVHPIFTDIFQQTNLSSPPVLLMSDDPNPNGLVISNNTMVLTKGLLAECPRQEVAAVIAHEFGHIVNGDAREKLVGFAINKAGDLTLGIVAGIILLVSNNGQRVIFFPFVAIAVVLKLIRSILARILLLGFFAIDRKSESKADAFVAELGLGEHMISFLEKSEDSKKLAFNRTHPRKKDRITMLQRYSES